MRVDLRPIGIGTFLAALVLVSCNGYSTATGGSSPTVAPSQSPGSPTPTPTGLTPPPTTTPTGPTTPSPEPSGGSALIIFSGSFEFGPFSIQVFTNLVATITAPSGQFNEKLPYAVGHPFWKDLRENLPVSDIKIGTCPKPTAAPLDITTITYQNASSPDVSCPGEHVKTKILYNDILAIENFLGLRSKAARTRF